MDFPLEANQFGVGLAPSVEQLEALRYAIDEVVNGDSRDVPIETLAREGFRVQGCWAVPIPPTKSPTSLAIDELHWRRVSGAWADPSVSFEVATSFTKRDVAVPREVLIQLVIRLRALRDEILAGKREGRIDDTPVPPPRQLTPELEEYERLRTFSRADADAYAAELYAHRAEQAVGEQIARPDQTGSSSMQVDDDTLREIAALADDVDRLDAEASRSDEPYADEQLDARLVAKRSRLLLELEVAGVLGSAERGRLERLGLAKLVAYSDAAVAMDHYLDSPGYARLVKQPRVTRLVDSCVSLDWFRVPSGYVPDGVAPDDWLALCEANFRANERPRAGSVFVRLEGKFHRLMFRTELDKPRLYRAVLA
ncbi:MAG TPA: hypothetical protein VF516_39135 [Kofleriaceae bacterium]